MKSVKLFLLVGLLIALVGGGPPLVHGSGDSDDNGGTGTSQYKTHDELMLDIGRRVPEFGGMYLSEDNSILYVYVTDGYEDVLKREEVKEAIEDVLKAGLTTRRELRLIQAQFPMSKLYEWYIELQGPVFRNPNVVMTDLDEGQNRIEIGMDDRDAIAGLRASLASLNIPEKAIVISVRERPVLAAHTLRNRATGNELEGGYQITGTVNGAELGFCTLGFNTIRNGEAGFVTAGHCTERAPWDGGVDGTVFHQPDSATNPAAIAVETIDPLFSADNRRCEAGRVCRLSDAAFVRLNAGISQNVGKIAKTTAVGSLTVDHNAKFRIVAENTITVEGEIVNKVGRTTGWTSGPVIDTCMKTDLEGNRTLLCQTVTNVESEPGDSGSPVFKWADSGDLWDVELVGVLWAGNSNPDPNRNDEPPVMWFSPIGNVYP